MEIALSSGQIVLWLLSLFDAQQRTGILIAEWDNVSNSLTSISQVASLLISGPITVGYDNQTYIKSQSRSMILSYIPSAGWMVRSVLQRMPRSAVQLPHCTLGTEHMAWDYWRWQWSTIKVDFFHCKFDRSWAISACAPMHISRTGCVFDSLESWVLSLRVLES